MKKLKLITSLSSLAVVGTALPIFASGCTIGPSQKETLSLNIGALPTLVAPDTIVGDFEIKAFTTKGPATISKIDVEKNTNPNSIRITPIPNTSKISVQSYESGTSDITLKVTDTNSNEGKLDFTFTVSNTSISINASSVPSSIGINYDQDFAISATKEGGGAVTLSSANVTIHNQNPNIVQASWTNENKLKIKSFNTKGLATIKLDVDNHDGYEGSITLFITVEYQNVQLILNTSEIPNRMDQSVVDAKYTITARRLNEAASAIEDAPVTYVYAYPTGTGIKSAVGSVESNKGVVKISTEDNEGDAELTIFVIDDKQNVGVSTISINVKTTQLAKNHVITTTGKVINLPDNLDPNYFAARNDDGQFVIGDSGIVLEPIGIKSLAITSCDPNKKVINTSHELPVTGPGFLEGCSELISLDISGLANVTNLGDNFLRRCSKLTSVDFNSLTNVDTIGHFFLNACSKLQSVNLQFLSKVTNIDSYFMSACSSITSLDLSPLSNVTKIANAFLTSLDKLKTIDLSPLKNVTTIGTGFLASQESLKEIDMSQMSKLTEIGAYFLEYCSNLQTIKLPIPKSGTIPTLLEDSSLEESYTWGYDVAASVDETRVFNIDCGSTKYYEQYVADENWNLITTTLESKTKSQAKIVNWVQSTENKIIYYDADGTEDDVVSAIQENVDLSVFANDEDTIVIDPTGLDPIYIAVENVKAIVINSIDYDLLTEEAAIPDYFLSGCSNMTDLIFGKLPAVTSIGTYFLSNCKSLKHLDLSTVTGVDSIGTLIDGAFFLESCTALETLTLWSTMPTYFYGWSEAQLSALKTIHCGTVEAADAYASSEDWSGTTAKTKIPNAEFVA